MIKTTNQYCLGNEQLKLNVGIMLIAHEHLLSPAERLFYTI